MLDERREFARFDTSLEVAIKTSKYSEELFAGEIRNVSLGGVCVETPDIEPAVKERMELRVKFPDLETFVSVSGNVAWNEHLDDKCLLGIELTEIDSEAKRQFSRMCR